MRKILIAGLVLVAALLSTAFAVLRNDSVMLDAFAMRVPDVPLVVHAGKVAPHIRLEASPEAAGDLRLPSIVQFHGCSGYRPHFMKQWADAAAEAGWRAFSVDSHAFRGIDPDTARQTVCKGKRLLGQERAADVLAALETIAARSDVDPARIVVAGWSHGAWTLMDLFAMDLAKRPPAGLSADGLSAPQIAGAVLFYPHCGRGAWSYVNDWTISPPTLAFVAGEDTIVDGAACKATFEELEANGHDIELVYYPNADHVFDDPTLAEFYSAEEADDSRARLIAFLGSLR